MGFSSRFGPSERKVMLMVRDARRDVVLRVLEGEKEERGERKGEAEMKRGGE